MSAQTKAAAFQQKNNRQRSTPMGERAHSGGQQEWNQHSSMPLFPLDDPVLEGIKCNLTTSSRIGFEPISRRFARIAFFIKNRMEIKLIGFKHEYNYKHPEKNSLQLVVNSKNGKNNCAFYVAINDLETALHALFLRIRKWHSVEFASYDSRFKMETGQLLSAILDESRPVVDIRRFSCRLVNEHEKLAEFLHRSAPTLRSLSLALGDGLELLPALIRAIGACHELRRLAFAIHVVGRFLPSLLPTILGLEKLDGLFVDYWWTNTFVASRHSLSIAYDWLPFFAQPAFYQLFKKMKNLNVEERLGISLSVAELTQILSEMRSPARAVIGPEVNIDWPEVWDVFLPLAHSTRANILIFLRIVGLPALTMEEFATRLSTLPAILQTSLIASDLQNSPLDEYNCYLSAEFPFSNGGQLTVKAATNRFNDEE